jgi:hypothetical protein
MSIEKKNPEQSLDEIIGEIRAETMDDASVGQAAARVWKKLEQASGPVAAEPHQGSFQRCEDFQSLIPAHLAKQLSEGQALLFEDHIHACAACRQTLERSRTGNVVEFTPAVTRRTIAPQWRWAVAAALAVGVGIGAWQMRDSLIPAPSGPRGVVQNVTGVLYRVSESGAVPISKGTELSEHDEIRTARGSSAMLRLTDGSLIEMRERSELWLSRRFSGATIRLERGSVIVQAAKQRSGTLQVATNDCLVSVKGTVFSVNQGTKGSRVSVIEGQVRVEGAQGTKLLHPGQQAATDAAMAAVPIQDEIAWSQNLDQYLALLGEFAVMQKQLAQLPGPGLRYSSRLLDLVPDGTVLYVAIPNIGGMLGDAQRIFQERLDQSQVLRDWWTQQGSSEKLTQALETVRGFSDYLGNEVVLAVADDGAGKYRPPLIVAEVTRSSFREYIEQQMAKASGDAKLTIVEDPASLPAVGVEHGGYALLMGGVVAVSPAPENLRSVAALIRQPGSGMFSKSSFYQRISDSYRTGAGWLVSADMEQIVPQSVSRHKGERAAAGETETQVFGRLGVLDMQHLLVERKDIAGKTENRAVVTFAQTRRGMAAWLAAPAPMGALDFISPDANLAVAFVVKQPRAALDELFSAINAVDPNFATGQAEFESRTGLRVLDDLAGPLGGEMAFALDGPLLPVPSWKFAIEVYDPARLQHTIEALVARSGDRPVSTPLQLTEQRIGDRTYYMLRSASSPLEMHYTFTDGYLVAAASQALVGRAIAQRAAGISLPRSAAFKSLQAPDRHNNFSAVLYQSLGSVVGPLADTLRATGTLTPEQQKSLDALKANSAPSLIYAYGEPDRIELASTGSFFGFNLDSIAGGGGPFAVGSVIEKTLRMRPKQ